MNLNAIEQQALLTVALAQLRGRPGMHPVDEAIPSAVVNSLAALNLVRVDPFGVRLTLRGMAFVRNAEWSAYRE